MTDMLQRGLGRAARHVGDWCNVYRPTSPCAALAPTNQFLRLRAAFLPPNGRSSRPVGYGQVTWQGVFDAAYTKPGDFLVRQATSRGAADGGIWFVASQQPLLPVLCVRTCAVIDVERPLAAMAAGIGTYGGVAPAQSMVVLSGCPAAIVQAQGRGNNPTDLPTDVLPGSWTVLLPHFATLVLRADDRITDDRGRSAIIAAAELTDLGWRVLARETNT